MFPPALLTLAGWLPSISFRQRGLDSPGSTVSLSWVWEAVEEIHKHTLGSSSHNGIQHSVCSFLKMKTFLKRIASFLVEVLCAAIATLKLRGVKKKMWCLHLCCPLCLCRALLIIPSRLIFCLYPQSRRAWVATHPYRPGFSLCSSS